MKKAIAVLLICVFSITLISVDQAIAASILYDSSGEEKGTTVDTEDQDSGKSTSQVRTEEEVEALINENKKDGLEEEGVETTGTSNITLTAKSAVLIEGSTGEILFEKDKDLVMEPASITKIMTLILIFEALDAGKIALTDQVSVSEHAASMGGSQVYLEPFETQTVETMIKCISISSANDACVAMAEFIAGSEEEFVARMNAKAKELGMTKTNFENSCGLDDSTVNHVSTAYDVALMSRELITKHPEISKYATTWMDTFTHVTKKGESEFGLTNTNKLVRTYKGITGLKTGSTAKAKYCLSASANRNGMDLIAVVMSAPEPKVRFAEAATLLDYGFANCSIYKDDHKDMVIDPVSVAGGAEDTVAGKAAKDFSYVCLNGKNPADVTREVVINEDVTAPVTAGDEVGSIIYKLNGEEIGRVSIIAGSDVRKATFGDALSEMLHKFFMIRE